MKDSLAKHIAIIHHLTFLPSLHHKSSSITVGIEEEKNVGEIGNEGVKLCPNEPLAWSRPSKRKTTRRGTVVQLTFLGRTAYPYKVCHCFVRLSAFL